VVEVDAGLALSGLASVLHAQGALETSDQVFSAWRRTQGIGSLHAAVVGTALCGITVGAAPGVQQRS
jgi:hypothetical protein